MDRWTEIELFVRTAELGSVSKAAEKLGISLSAASRYLIALESRLGARLIERSTRRSRLTEVGLEHFERCKNILNYIQEAESMVSATSSNPTGVLRLTSTLSFCMKHIAPVLPEYARRYPDVRVEVEVGNRYFNMLDNDIDLAVRTREFEADSNITIRHLAETRRVLAASHGYLTQFGVPKVIDDLLQHRLLLYSYSNRPDELHFKRDGISTVVGVKAFMKSNDMQVTRAAAIEGLGIVVSPKYVIYDDIVSGRLVPVLDAWDLPRLSINMAYPSRKFMPAKTRTFMEFLLQHFERMEYERKWTE